ncbi:MAG: recombination mediator RecR [Patescibacteria group bacterium]|nr:recombination mediator RecR [Patescibacteria group bacterium]
MKIPKPIENLIEHFEKLPGIGPKTAQRLTFYLLHNPQTELENFADTLTRIKTDTKMCAICKNIDIVDPCEICSSASRNNSVIAVVETPLDALALERARYNGLYHILHGVINPLQSIGPDEIYINDLIKRLAGKNEIKEIILALNPTMEGETTSFYIAKLVEKEISNKVNEKIKITRIGRGLPTGASLEYADETTLGRAMEGRTPI